MEVDVHICLLMYNGYVKPCYIVVLLVLNLLKFQHVKCKVKRLVLLGQL